MVTLGGWGFLISEVPLHVSVSASLWKFRTDVIRKKAWSFYRTISSVLLCWELEELKGPKGPKEPKGPHSVSAPETAACPDHIAV